MTDEIRDSEDVVPQIEVNVEEIMNSVSIDMNLDEMIWDLGMNLPSWDNDNWNESSGEIK